jgi:hypothetical protein
VIVVKIAINTILELTSIFALVVGLIFVLKTVHGAMTADPLEQGGKLCEFDYTFLKGDEEAWPCWGAAMSVVMEYCKNQGLGSFGSPTYKGLRKMEEYERENLGIG